MAVIGAGNTAITEALYLADICAHVHILVRGERSRAEDIWIDKARERANITFHYNTQASSVEGSMMGVTGLKLTTGETLPLDGIFVAIGSSPYTKIVDGMSAEKDSEGCLVVDKRQETSVK